MAIVLATHNITETQHFKKTEIPADYANNIDIIVQMTDVKKR